MIGCFQHNVRSRFIVTYTVRCYERLWICVLGIHDDPNLPLPSSARRMSTFSVRLRLTRRMPSAVLVIALCAVRQPDSRSESSSAEHFSSAMVDSTDNQSGPFPEPLRLNF